jgi:acyl-coenzyme A synthetase/AMP-(fatty) acid ligase
VILPFFYSYGNSLLLTHIYVGGTLVVADQFVYLNKLVELMVREGVTGFSGVPSSYAMLLRKSVLPKTKFETLRYVTCAGGALAKSFIEELQACLPHTELYIMYGQTEASARLSYLAPIDLPRKTGSIGKGIPGVVLKVLNRNGIEVAPGEVGEVVAQGENIMQGYWNNPDATLKVLKGRQLYTGDLATVDDDGFIYILGRQSDLIKSGSYRIHPGEIEEILNAHPCVVESVVVGVEDKILGEAITAYVIIRPSYTLTPSDLLQFAREFLPSYKMPKKVFFVEHLPKTASGKIRRNILREQLEMPA